MERDAPDRYVATMSKKKRQGRIFIDHLRNSRSASAIAPYSPRARAGAPVAWPLRWQDLGQVSRANEVTLAAARRRLARENGWPGYAGLRQGIRQSSLRALGL